MTQPVPTVLPDLGRLARAGDGSSAIVYRAKDGQGHAWAVKVSHDEKMAAPFAGEALARGATPNPPRFIGLAGVEETRLVDGGRPTLIYPWTEGLPLTTVAPPFWVLARNLALAVSRLHRRGWAHGDLKPENVLVRANGCGIALLDFGLASFTDLRTTPGGSPRYLALGEDADLGTAENRDLLALGLVLAEVAEPALRDEAHLLERARRHAWPAPLDSLFGPLLAANPAARPPAAWVAREAARADRASPPPVEAPVTAAYLAVEQKALLGATAVADGVGEEAFQLVRVANACRAMFERLARPRPNWLSVKCETYHPPLGARRRTIARLIGPASSSWPVSHPDLALSSWLERLERAAAETPPAHWSFGDVNAALGGQSLDRRRPVDRTDLPRVIHELLATPPRRDLLEALEAERHDLEPSVRLCAAEALRREGEVGRALALLGDRPAAYAARLERLAGNASRAHDLARQALLEDEDGDGVAGAVLARLAFDRGDYEKGLKLARETDGPRAAEVAALCQAHLGHAEAALAEAERARGLAAAAEEKARAEATRAYLLKPHDSEGAARAFAHAVQYAAMSGAVLEEATYRTGEASVAVDRGQLRLADESAERAALLWEFGLSRPRMAARAWLARAAAALAVDDHEQARRFAEACRSRAQTAGDRRAEVYAQWAIADAHPPGHPVGKDAAADGGRLPDGATDGERLHTLARQLRHRLCKSSEGDALAATTGMDLEAQLTWWTTRASQSDGSDRPLILGALRRLAHADAPPAPLGKAMAAATQLASDEGQADAELVAIFEKTRLRCAARLREGCGGHPELSAAAERAPWMRRTSVLELTRQQSVDLQALVRALSERRSLSGLLGRVIDLLLLWTGAERGWILLLDERTRELTPEPSADGNEVGDVEGQFSVSLATRALERDEAIVAVDATEEWSDRHASVHDLQLRSVLAIPLRAGGRAVGVAYLEDRIRRGAFGSSQVAAAQAIAPVAALAIDDARRRQELEAAVDHAKVMQARLETEVARTESALDVASQELRRQRRATLEFEGMVGESEPMQKLYRLIERVATSHVPVLLRGESGVGKELVARALHRRSSRDARPFVGENCGALPDSLLESTLFGHVRGAFTGADRSRMGLFEAADGGTLFLDEVGEMSLAMQAKLLRVLEEHVVRPVGANSTRPIDVRIIAATHRDLEAMVGEGTFREDLYYRLNVLTVAIPPLRERPGDIDLLVEWFTRRHRETPVRITDAARGRLRQFSWPGNVRQLENELRRALLLSDDVIDVEHLTIEHAPPPARSPPKV